MSNPKRVFITGRSVLSAAGNTAQATWQSICQGKSGIRPISQWNLEQWHYRLGGELTDFQPAKSLPDRKLSKVISPHDAMGICAAVQAVEESGMLPYRDGLTSAEDFNEQTAVYVGSPGNKYVQQYDFLPLLAKTQGDMHAFAQQLFAEVHPMWLLRILPNNVLAYTGITYGFKGPNHNITNHAVGGTQALLEAFHAIQSGQAERAVVVAYDLGVEPQALFYYEQLGVLSARHLNPFDKDHDGTVLADGAAAIVLESEASVQARSATCYAELIGGYAKTEAAGLFSLENEGEHLTDLIAATLIKTQLTSADVGFVVAHGNGNPQSDNTEALAINAVFADRHVPVTAFKWSMGHTLCASGLVDAVMTTYALGDQQVPGIAPLEEVASACAGLAVSASTQPLTKPHALLINRGFASMNACVVIKACD